MPHPHIHSPAYAPPVLRPASPASSLGTSYDPPLDTVNKRSLSDAATDKDIQSQLRLGREFAREWSGDIEKESSKEDWESDDDDGWHERVQAKDRDREGWGNEPLIAFGQGARTEAEDKYIHDKILRSLRYQVHLLEENEIFEQTLLRGSQAATSALEHQAVPTSSDIDSLMRSMMTLSPPASSHSSSRRDQGSIGTVTAHPTPTITNGPWSRGGTTGGDVSSTPARRSASKGKARSRR